MYIVYIVTPSAPSGVKKPTRAELRKAAEDLGCKVSIFEFLLLLLLFSAYDI